MDEVRKKSDRRVVKTKRAIRNAFITLLAKKDYNDISVKDIADVADVDRKTVYNYYSGIYAIREELENELVGLWNDAIEKLDVRNNLANPQRIFATLTEIINSNLELYSNLMKLDARSHIVRKMTVALTEKVQGELEKSSVAHLGNRRLEYMARFITSGMLAAYQSWFNSDRALPLEELSKGMGDFVLYGIKGLERDQPAQHRLS